MQFERVGVELISAHAHFPCFLMPRTKQFGLSLVADEAPTETATLSKSGRPGDIRWGSEMGGQSLVFPRGPLVSTSIYMLQSLTNRICRNTMEPELLDATVSWSAKRLKSRLSKPCSKVMEPSAIYYFWMCHYYLLPHNAANRLDPTPPTPPSPRGTPKPQKARPSQSPSRKPQLEQTASPSTTFGAAHCAEEGVGHRISCNLTTGIQFKTHQQDSGQADPGFFSLHPVMRCVLHEWGKRRYRRPLTLTPSLQQLQRSPSWKMSSPWLSYSSRQMSRGIG